MPEYPRDFQRKRIYTSDEVLADFGVQFASLEEIQKYVDALVKSRWFRLRWRGCKHIMAKRVYRSFAQAWGDEYGVIELPYLMWSENIVLHEVAHICTAVEFGDFVPVHGSEFATTYLKLVKRQMGNFCYRLLRDTYDLNKVKYEPLA